MFQAILHKIYPSQCPGCDCQVQADHTLCPACWAEVPFVRGCHCNTCGQQLPGEDAGIDLMCDTCLEDTPIWDRGRAVMMYGGKARSMVLALKHGDRLDLVPTLSGWLTTTGESLISQDSVLIPVPLHWRRLFKRRYNQSGLLAQALAKKAGCGCLVDGLRRIESTPSLDGKTKAERFEILQNAIQATPKRVSKIKGASVVLIDDVMTSGATFTACTMACHAAGASAVSVLALARVGKAP